MKVEQTEKTNPGAVSIARRSAGRNARRHPRCLVRFNDVRPTDRLGGKAGALARLSTAGFPIPPWIALTPEAFDISLGAVITVPITRRNQRDIKRRLTDIQLAPALRRELESALRKLAPPGTLFAVRSSAVDEDSPQHSFAGQLQSYLFVSLDDVAARVADVWRSGFSSTVRKYRRERGLSALGEAPAVLIQQMVDADASGVAFSADPMTGDRSVCVVSAVPGLGTALVSGECDGDTYHVSIEGHIVSRKIARKKLIHRRASSGGAGVETSHLNGRQACAPVLGDDLVTAVSDLARKSATFFGRAQDIEWAVIGKDIFLLQSRSITSLAGIADPNGTLRVWDNSNINESYAGITTPLTFSFARQAYEGAYRQLLKVFRTPRQLIEDNRSALANMVGMIRGRIYYNMLSWYQLLGLLPGAHLSRRFHNQMIGVREDVPTGVPKENEKISWHVKVVDLGRVAIMIASVIANYFLLSIKRRRFHIVVKKTLTQQAKALHVLRPDELAAEYRRIESQLSGRWDAPLINDFFLMIFHGLLRTLCGRWCGDATGTMQNDLLCATGGMISAEPAARMRQMAALARDDAPFVEALCMGDADTIFSLIDERPEFRRHFDSYLREFGERCSNELKLECPSLDEDPLMLLRSIGVLATSGEGRGADIAQEGSHGRDACSRAKARVRAELGSNWFRRVVFQWVLHNTRRYVRGRENLRIERTRLYGSVRRIFVELGKRFHEMDLLERPDDVLYLQIEEILGFVEGTSTCTNLRGLAGLRKREFQHYATLDPPDDRFETRGVVYQGNSFRTDRNGPQVSGNQRIGMGCCSGRVSGRVRVVHDPRRASLKAGDILVAEHTDPSWIMLFPCAAGLLVERGNLLSHSAIVARELGIPAIVSIKGVMKWLRDGDQVELDGTTGVVTKLAPKEGEPS